jgi:hypothetical protein
MKSLYLFIVTAGAMMGGCAERPSGSAPPDGPRYGLANEATRGLDPTVRYGGPSGRYGRPSKAPESEAR